MMQWSRFTRDCFLAATFAVLVIVYGTPVQAQVEEPGSAVVVVPKVAAGIPIHLMAGIGVELAALMRIRPSLEVNSWRFQDACELLCFDHGLHVDAGLGTGTASDAAGLRPFLGTAAGMLQRRAVNTGELYRSATLRGRAGIDYALAGGAAVRAELGLVHLFDDPGHGMGPLAYLALGLAVPVWRR